MQISAPIYKREGLLSNSTLLILAFASVFFPRILDSLGAPSVVNFLHFGIVPLVTIWILRQDSLRDRQHIDSCKALLVGMCVLFVIAIASALLNDAGLINAILSFIILAEPFLFLLALVWAPVVKENLEKLKKWLIIFSVFHIALCFAQVILVNAGILKSRLALPQDNIQGVFWVSGGGHVVSSSVIISFALYFLLGYRKTPLLMRLPIVLSAILINQFAETKQTLLVSFFSFFLLVSMKPGNIKKLIQYVAIGGLLLYGFWWLTQNVELFRGYNTWADLELYGPNGEATQLKIYSIRSILSHYFSSLNWLFGLGPGHTVSRLGGWILDKYWSLFRPLGATRHIVVSEVWREVATSRLGPRSSMFSPLWGWAGLWGDLGFLGVITYLYLFWIIWLRFCKDDLSRFFLIGIIINGLIFSQMEEPGYTLYTMFLIAMIWHQKREKISSSNSYLMFKNQYLR